MSLKICDKVKIREEDFGALVFTNRTPILVFNHDALAIWKLIDGKRDIDDIVKILSSSNDKHKEKIYKKVEEFIITCINLGLIIRDNREEKETL